MYKYVASVFLATLILLFNVNNTLADNNQLNVAIFSTKKNDYICVSSHSIIQQINMPLSKEMNWCIKPESSFLSLYQNKGKLNHHMPKKITLQSPNNKPVCLTSSTNQNRCYYGTITISNKNKELKINNRVSFTDYLHSAVASELPQNWPEEAIKAQTVAIHSYILNKLEHNQELQDSTQNVFYGGALYENAIYNNYINQVKNIIITDKDNKPIEALFHSTCAGGTLNNESVFKGLPKEYLRATPCNYCTGSNFYKTHSFKIKKEELLRSLHTNNLEIFRTNSNEIEAITLNDKTFTPYEFWLKLGESLGWGATPGIKYDLKYTKDYYQITSKGAGHAIGLCQWGSKKMATMGYKYTDILRFYYKNILFFDINTKAKN